MSWKCFNQMCPDRKPVEYEATPVCYTCDELMTYVKVMNPKPVDFVVPGATVASARASWRDAVAALDKVPMTSAGLNLIVEAHDGKVIRVENPSLGRVIVHTRFAPSDTEQIAALREWFQTHRAAGTMIEVLVEYF